MQMNQQKQNLVIDKNKLVIKKKIIIPRSTGNQLSYQKYSDLKKQQFLRFDEKFHGYFR